MSPRRTMQQIPHSQNQTLNDVYVLVTLEVSNDIQMLWKWAGTSVCMRDRENECVWEKG